MDNTRLGKPGKSSRGSNPACWVIRTAPPRRVQSLVYLSSVEFRGSEGESVCSVGTGLPGTQYSSLTQRPRSISLQRSEQNGRKGLFFHSTGLPQIGQVMNLCERSSNSVCYFNLAQQGFWSLNQNFPINEFDRTFTPHRIQAHCDAFAR
jgi:hypothetical protein